MVQTNANGELPAVLNRTRTRRDFAALVAGLTAGGAVLGRAGAQESTPAAPPAAGE